MHALNILNHKHSEINAKYAHYVKVIARFFLISIAKLHLFVYLQPGSHTVSGKNSSFPPLECHFILTPKVILSILVFLEKAPSYQ